MRLVRDVPGSVLDLVESPRRFDRSSWVFGLLFAFEIVPLIPLMPAVSGMGGRMSVYPIPWLCIGASYAVWCSLVTVLYLLSSRCVRRFVVDRADGYLSIEEVGALRFLPRQRSLPLSSIDRITVKTDRNWGRIRTELPLQVCVCGARAGRHRVRIEIEGLHDRRDLVDFALRLAQAAGLRGHAVERDDERTLEVALGSADATPIPTSTTPLAWLHDVAGSGSVPSNEANASFDHGSFHSVFRVEAWAPGTYVRLFKPTDSVGCAATVLLLLATGGGLMAWRATFDTNPCRWIGWVLGAMFFAAPFVILIWLAKAAAQQLTIIDWTTRKITIHRGRRTREVPFGDLTGIETRAVRIHHSGWRNKEGEYSRYEAQIWARSRSEEVLLAGTYDEPETPSTPFHCPLALGAALAGAIGVPHRYRYYQ